MGNIKCRDCNLKLGTCSGPTDDEGYLCDVCAQKVNLENSLLSGTIATHDKLDDRDIEDVLRKVHAQNPDVISKCHFGARIAKAKKKLYG